MKTYGMTTALDAFVESLRESPLPCGDLDTPLGGDGVTAFRSNNGRLSYATSGIPGMDVVR